MGETRKVKHAGRFGARYGKGIRDRVVEIEKKQRSFHPCPSCGFERVKRISTGLYECRKCGYKFAGGAYTPSTMSGRIVRKMVSQRKFLPMAKELIEAREENAKGPGKEKAKGKSIKEEGKGKGKAKEKKERKAKGKKGKEAEKQAKQEEEAKSPGPEHAPQPRGEDKG